MIRPYYAYKTENGEQSMYKILKKESLNPTVTLMEIDAAADCKKGGARTVYHSSRG